MKGGCLVKEIQMKNFRSLKDTGSQKLSPITLLVGENSSGKSSFLRAFPLLKQSISKRTSGPILWAGDVDDYVDFGSFEETVTNDQSDEIIFAFKFRLNNGGRTSGYRFYDDYGVFEYALSDADICYEITITSSEGKDQVSHLSLCVNSTTVRFDLVQGTITTDKGFCYKETDEEQEITLKGHSRKVPFRRYTRTSPSFGFELPSIDAAVYTVLNGISLNEDEEIDFFTVRRIMNEIGLDLTRGNDVEFIDNKTRKKKKYPAAYVRHYNSIVSALKDDPTGECGEITKLVAIYELFPEVDDYLFSYFKQVHYIAPLRANAERYYRLRNLAIDEVDYQGKNLPVFINSLTVPQLKAFHSWTEDHFGFKVKTDKSKGHLSLQIILSGSDKAINLSDTGFGYSQVLPIITQLWELSSHKPIHNRRYTDRNQKIPLVIAIEQPELHLHPAVQAKLAKAFIASIDNARKNKCELQLLLETHSPTIVDYFGRAIAKGILVPEDISVILFDKGINDSVTTVRESSYDKEGFLKDWPYGFFEAED